MDCNARTHDTVRELQRVARSLSREQEIVSVDGLQDARESPVVIITVGYTFMRYDLIPEARSIPRSRLVGSDLFTLPSSAHR